MHSPGFSLQHESSNQAVDWDAIDDELGKIPSELKDPRFDSLRHVLNILSAVDAEAALEEVNRSSHAEQVRSCVYILQGFMHCSFEDNETR